MRKQMGMFSSKTLFTTQMADLWVVDDDSRSRTVLFNRNIMQVMYIYIKFKKKLVSKLKVKLILTMYFTSQNT